MVNVFRSLAHARTGLSTRTHLVLLVFALLVPVVAFAAILAGRYAAAERAGFERQALQTAQQVAALIDRDLAGLQTALRTLSTSARIRSGEFEAFHRQALEVRGFLGEHIVLRDLSGQQLVNTRVPWGTALPRSALAVDAEVIATQRPVISDVFVGAVAGAPIFSVVAPVLQDDVVTHLLSLSIATERLVPLLRAGLQPQWAAGAFDRNGLFIAQSERHADVSGRPGPKPFIDAATSAQGVWRGDGLLGAPVLLGHAQSSLAGWRIWAGAPGAVIEAPWTRALWLLAGLGLALLAASLAMAYTVGAQIAR